MRGRQSDPQGACWAPSFLPTCLFPSLVSGRGKEPESPEVDGVRSRLCVDVLRRMREGDFLKVSSASFCEHHVGGPRDRWLSRKSLLLKQVNVIISWRLSFLVLTRELVSLEGGEQAGNLKRKLNSECDECCKIFTFHFLKS